ncbi:Rpn family recombination-promoting nuclease/putative transposase, partial [Desulfobacterales bacterium HSG16]|nr:Rpn family recombination-promoting nuclease/putative transposase [Desulfobacterales bacterium HSG16]
MENLLTPKLDYVFKMLFTRDTEILVDLINSVLDLSGDRLICSIKVLNPGILPETIKSKFIILDIRATDEAGRQYDIEVQVKKYDSWPKRVLYYISRMYGNQLKSGDEYEKLNPVIGIYFQDYKQFPKYKDKFHFCFELRDEEYPELRLTDDMSLHIFELPKFDQLEEKQPADNNLNEWLHFFNHAHEEKEKSMRTHYTNPKIGKAFNILESLSSDTEVWTQALEREKALRDEISMLASARREGEKNGFVKGEKTGFVKGEKTGFVKGEKTGFVKGERLGIEKTAKNLFLLGTLSIEEISRATGLSIAEIK